MPTVKASKATVEADTIRKSTREKHHQTNTHNAQMRIAKGNVEVRIDKQYPTRADNTERPAAGSVLKGDSATISARGIPREGQSSKSPKRREAVFKDDVTISMSGGGSKPKPKSSSASKKSRTGPAKKKR